MCNDNHRRFSLFSTGTVPTVGVCIVVPPITLPKLYKFFYQTCRIRIRSVQKFPISDRMWIQKAECLSSFLKSEKGRGTLLHGGYLYFFSSSKMEQTLHSPSYGSQEPAHKEKLKKKFFDLLFGPFKKVIFCSFYAFPGGT